jgi:hypothetical protein
MPRGQEAASGRARGASFFVLFSACRPGGRWWCGEWCVRCLCSVTSDSNRTRNSFLGGVRVRSEEYRRWVVRRLSGVCLRTARVLSQPLAHSVLSPVSFSRRDALTGSRGTNNLLTVGRRKILCVSHAQAHSSLSSPSTIQSYGRSAPFAFLLEAHVVDSMVHGQHSRVGQRPWPRAANGCLEHEEHRVVGKGGTRRVVDAAVCLGGRRQVRRHGADQLAVDKKGEERVTIPFLREVDCTERARLLTTQPDVWSSSFVRGAVGRRVRGLHMMREGAAPTTAYSLKRVAQCGMAAHLCTATCPPRPLPSTTEQRVASSSPPRRPFQWYAPNHDGAPLTISMMSTSPRSGQHPRDESKLFAWRGINQCAGLCNNRVQRRQ